MKAGLLFRLACLCIASVVLMAHFARKFINKMLHKPKLAH
jgi:hypothetical protein